MSFTARDWFIKYILPIIIVPIISSYIVVYGAVRSIVTQQEAEVKRVDQLQKESNMSRVEISALATRVSKVEVILESLDRTLTRQTDISDKFLIEMRKITREISDVKESMAILKDRDDRKKNISTN